MAENEKEKEKVAGDALLAKALKAYEINPKHVFASSVVDGVVTILTNGGIRVKFRDGDEVTPIADPVKIHGESPKKPRVVMGKKKEK